VRLALAAKGLAADGAAVNLATGEQRAPSHLAINAQGLVPVLRHGDLLLTQSLAIIEYLDEVWPAPPLLPGDAAGRALVRGAAQVVAAEIHPLGNARVQRYLRAALNADDAAVTAWLHQWLADGLGALEAFATRHGGRHLFGDTLTLADLVLVPQLYNARRFGFPLAGLPRLLAAEALVLARPELAATAPECQPDAAI
jgi:maleylacetoacetate isomerase